MKELIADEEVNPQLIGDYLAKLESKGGVVDFAAFTDFVHFLEDNFEETGDDSDEEETDEDTDGETTGDSDEDAEEEEKDLREMVSWSILT